MLRNLRSRFEKSGESTEPHVDTRGHAAVPVRCLWKQLQDGEVFGVSQVEAQHEEDLKLPRVRILSNTSSYLNTENYYDISVATRNSTSLAI